MRSLANRALFDERGQPRVAFYTPNWEDCVHISLREIRLAGTGNLQIERRLRAMIANLALTLPESRHTALRCELELLDAAIERGHLFEKDVAVARIGHTQGLGGSSSASFAGSGRSRTWPNAEPFGFKVALTSRHVVSTAKGKKRGATRRASSLARPEISEEFHAFLQAALHHLPTDQHLANDFPNLRRPEVEPFIEFLNAAIDLFARQVWIADC
jgi:hypothetical protein